MGSGTGAEVLGGIAGIVLGNLSLIGLAPVVLVAVAVIVFGGALLISCGAAGRLNSLSLRSSNLRPADAAGRLMMDILGAANGIQALAALAAIVLGIIALSTPYYPLVLTLVAVLCLGAAILITGGALTGRMATVISRR
jgi:hypothetical protein